MDVKTKRLLLFLIGCIGMRSLYAYSAYRYPKYLDKLAIPAIAIGLGFWYIYLTKSRTTGPEVFGDKIWWDSLRPIHGSLYLLFAYLALQGNRKAWLALALDVLIGFLAFVNNRN